MQEMLNELKSYIKANLIMENGYIEEGEAATLGNKASSQSANRYKYSLSCPTSGELAKEYVEKELQKAARFSELLGALIKERESATNADFYNKAQIDRRHFHKLVKDKVVPQRKTVLAMAIALELDLAQTEQLLQTVGYAFNPSSVSDLVIKFFIQRRHYDRFATDSTPPRDCPNIQAIAKRYAGLPPKVFITSSPSSPVILLPIAFAIRSTIDTIKN